MSLYTLFRGPPPSSQGALPAALVQLDPNTVAIAFVCLHSRTRPLLYRTVFLLVFDPEEFCILGIVWLHFCGIKIPTISCIYIDQLLYLGVWSTRSHFCSSLFFTKSTSLINFNCCSSRGSVCLDHFFVSIQPQVWQA